ncbi:MAG: type II secretion system protein N [Pseudomonadota bacterium]
MKRMPTLLSFLLFIALCATAAYWILQFWRPPVRPMAAPTAPPATDISLEAASGLFGGRPGVAVEASNYQLRGVVLADNGSESVAILAADGKPARAVRVNTEFQPGVTVREVHAQYILLSEGGIIKRVALPDPGRAVQQTDFGTSGLVPPASATSSSSQFQPVPQTYLAPQAPVQLVNPLPGQMPGQLPGQAMPVPPGQGLPGQTMSMPVQPAASQTNPAPGGGAGIFLPSRPPQ